VFADFQQDPEKPKVDPSHRLDLGFFQRWFTPVKAHLMSG